MLRAKEGGQQMVFRFHQLVGMLWIFHICCLQMIPWSFFMQIQISYVTFVPFCYDLRLFLDFPLIWLKSKDGSYMEILTGTSGCRISDFHSSYEVTGSSSWRVFIMENTNSTWLIGLHCVSQYNKGTSVSKVSSMLCFNGALLLKCLWTYGFGEGVLEK